LLALNAPIVVLFLAGFSSNKVEGLAAFKGINLVLIAPAAVMFIQGAWQYVFTVIPTYWLYQSLDLSAANQPWGTAFLVAIVAYGIVLVGLVVWFRKRVFF
jgi:fluoroquinolone transport system permease protein